MNTHESLGFRLFRGAAAGFIATGPMTLTMEALYRQLPAAEQEPLAPQKITMHAAEKAGVNDQLNSSQRLALTLVSHFGFGAAMGALYSAVSSKSKVSPLLKGTGLGLLVWSGSYLGLLPALNVLRPATEHPARRTGLMIAAHLVWGPLTAWLSDHLSEDDLQSMQGPDRVENRAA